MSSTISQVGDNIYVNVTMNDRNSENRSEFNVAGIAEYRVTKTIPILSKCNDYYCSIIRFSIPLNYVPLFIMPIVPNQANSNLTPFIIGITTGGLDFPQPVIYETKILPIPAPAQNQPTQVITPYYFVFEYQLLIDIVNTALANAFVASGLVGNTPYFYLDTNSGQIKLVVDIANFAPTQTGAVSPVPLATIFMNADLQVFFSAFSGAFVGINPNGRDFVFDLVRFGAGAVIGNGSDVNIPPFNIPIVALQKQFSQEYTVLPLWSSLKKILITTNTIPIVSEYTPANNPGNNSGISSTLPIITDFIPQIERPGDSRSIAFYNPTAQYRLVDLQSSEQLNTIDLKIFWQDIADNVYPLLISKYQQANIKLGFFKKSLYKGNYLLQ